MNKHIVKHIVYWSLRVNDPFLGALCPSKSGLMNKHIVKHTGGAKSTGKNYIHGAETETDENGVFVTTAPRMSNP